MKFRTTSRLFTLDDKKNGRILDVWAELCAGLLQYEADDRFGYDEVIAKLRILVPSLFVADGGQV